MGSLQKPKGAPHWIAFYKRWDAEKEQWVRAKTSTRCEDRESAEAFLEQLEATCKIARTQPKGSTMTEDQASALVRSILTAAGVSISGKVASPLLKDYLDRYMAQKEATVEPGSFKTYGTCRRSLDAFMPATARLSDLTAAKVRDYYTQLRTRTSTKTANDRFRWLRSMLNQAVAEDIIPKNPCLSVRLDKAEGVLGRKPLTLREARKIISKLWNSKDDRKREWSLAVSLSLMSGARLADCVTMQRSSLKKQGKGHVLTYTQAKSKKRVTVPLVLPGLVARLVEVKKGPLCPELAEEFARIGNAHLSSEFTGLVKECGIKQTYHTDKSGRRIAQKTFHSLRHTLRTSIVASGGSDAQADLILGHSSGQGKTYTHGETDTLTAVLTQALS